jgi:hypothetical protein
MAPTELTTFARVCGNRAVGHDVTGLSATVIEALSYERTSLST